MQSYDTKIDAQLRAFSKRWLRSIRTRFPSTNISYFLVGMFVFFWSASLTIELNYNPYQGIGRLILVAIGISLTLVLRAANTMLIKIGLEQPIRAALWLSVLVGPYVALKILDNTGMPAGAHLAGLASGFIAFWLSIYLGKLMARKDK